MNNTVSPPKPQLIPLSIATKIVPLSERRMQMLCRDGQIKSAVQPGGERGQWFVDRNEMLERVKPRE